MRFPVVTRPLVAAMAVGVCLLVAAVVGSVAGRAGKDAPARAVEMDLRGAVHDVGELHMTVSNWGMFGSMPGTGLFSGKPSAEWPASSGVEYLFYGGIWVSSSTWSPRVSTAVPVWEFRPPPDPIDVIYRTAEEAPGGNRTAHPRADDDGDGRVNEEWPDGRDNDGDGGTTTAHFGIVVLDIASTTEGPQPTARVVTYASFVGSAPYQNGGDTQRRDLRQCEECGEVVRG